MKEKGCYPTVVSYTAYMKILFDYKRVKEAVEVYKELLRSGCSPNCHTYTVLMAHLIESGKTEEALGLFSRMKDTGVEPDKATCNILVEKCSKAGATNAVIQVLSFMKESKLVLRYPVFLEAHEALKKAGESDRLLRQVNPHILMQDTGGGEIIDSMQAAQDINRVI
ncbi:Pentatricopeptide repeat-containing protein, partial [Drosera capensis]